MLKYTPFVDLFEQFWLPMISFFGFLLKFSSDDEVTGNSDCNAILGEIPTSTVGSEQLCSEGRSKWILQTNGVVLISFIYPYLYYCGSCHGKSNSFHYSEHEL